MANSPLGVTPVQSKRSNVWPTWLSGLIPVRKAISQRAVECDRDARSETNFRLNEFVELDLSVPPFVARFMSRLPQSWDCP